MNTTMTLNEVAAAIGGHNLKIVNVSGAEKPNSDWAIFRTEKVQKMTRKGKRTFTEIMGEKLAVSSVIHTTGVMNGQAVEFSNVVFNHAEIEDLLNA